MDSVGPGSLLAGRYRVHSQVRRAIGSTIWRAQDETLDRPVNLRVIDRGHPNAQDAVDAARRAAGVEESRLQRILDVGAEGDLSYIVSEWIGADTLTELVKAGAPPAEEVRRLVGEAASALEAARHRGLHHLALTPDSLLRSHDGPVTVSGLGVDAALLGLEVANPARASARDAHALVALIYAGLTQRWPLELPVGLEAAPRVGSALPPPSELASGVPADLDTLCRETLSEGLGPPDPGALATQLAPWPAHPVAGPVRATGSFPIALAAEPAGATTVIPAVGAPESVQSTVSNPRPGLAGRPAPPPPPVRPPPTHIPPAPPPQAVPPAAPTLPAVPTPAPAVAAPVTQAPPGFEPPAPLLPASPIARPPVRQTRAVIGVVAAFVVVLCLLAYCGLRQPGKHPAANSGSARPTASASNPITKPSSGASGSSSSATTTAAAGGSPLTIVGANGFDPQGDGSEKENLTKLAYDGKKSTGWVSDTYKSALWGGLKKGVGIRLDLGTPQRVSGATVRVGGSGATVQLRAVSGSSLAGSVILASRSGASGTLNLTASTPVTTRYVVIWFTVPAQFSDGYRAEVDDVQLR